MSQVQMSAHWVAERLLPQSLWQAWNVTAPNAFTDAHVISSAMKVRAAAEHTATNKISKYSCLTSTDVFHPVVIETAITWSRRSEDGRQVLLVTRETSYLFQQLSVALLKGNAAVSFQNMFTATVKINSRLMRSA